MHLFWYNHSYEQRPICNINVYINQINIQNFNFGIKAVLGSLKWLLAQTDCSRAECLNVIQSLEEMVWPHDMEPTWVALTQLSRQEMWAGINFYWLNSYKKKISYNVNKMSPTESECFYLASTNQALTHLTTISDSCQLLWAPLLCPASSHPSEMYKTRETKSTQSKSKSRVLNTLSMSLHSSKLRQKTQQQLCRHWQVWRTGPTPSSIFKCICLSLPSGKHICEQFRDSYS